MIRFANGRLLFFGATVICLLFVLTAVGQVPGPATDSIGVIELRNYVMKLGMRERFIPLFEENFVTSQDTLGGHILGRYRVKGSDDHFCWIRGFADMASRGVFLPAFYHGAVWRAHRDAANSMLANNDNVYLLKPMRFVGDSMVGAAAVSPAVLAPRQGVTVVQLFVANSKLAHLEKLFSGDYARRMRLAGFERYSVWTSELAENSFPQLPVFQDKNLLVVFSFFPAAANFEAAKRNLDARLGVDERADLEDTITLQSTWVLLPTEKSLIKK